MVKKGEGGEASVTFPIPYVVVLLSGRKKKRKKHQKRSVLLLQISFLKRKKKSIDDYFFKKASVQIPSISNFLLCKGHLVTDLPVFPFLLSGRSINIFSRDRSNNTRFFYSKLIHLTRDTIIYP